MADVLIVVGHGTDSAEGDGALHDLAAHLAGRDLFADVRVALLRGEPGLAAAMAGLGDHSVRLLPFLMSGAVTFKNRLVAAMRGFGWAQTPHIYPPLGFNPGLAPLLANRAQAARMYQRALAALDIFADVEVAFLDQPPRLDHILAHHQGLLIGIGLFAGEGRHGANEMVEAFAASSGPSVYCGAIGRDPGLAALAVEHLKQAPWPVDFNTQA